MRRTTSATRTLVIIVSSIRGKDTENFFAEIDCQKKFLIYRKLKQATCPCSKRGRLRLTALARNKRDVRNRSKF